VSQLFHPATNSLARLSIVGGVAGAAVAAWLAGAYVRSPYVSGKEVILEQPVPFSHQHHVAAIGIDCRYCHVSAEKGPVAGLPPVSTCMHCHSQIWADSPVLEPVRRAYREGRPIPWTRVHDLPDFVRFDHSVHVARGVGCVVCHGRVDRMPLAWKDATLFMEWCLDCHRHPGRAYRPPEAAFLMEPGPPRPDLAARLGLRARTDCDTCHQ
jgi:hypothetical protein